MELSIDLRYFSPLPWCIICRAVFLHVLTSFHKRVLPFFQSSEGNIANVCVNTVIFNRAGIHRNRSSYNGSNHWPTCIPGSSVLNNIYVNGDRWANILRERLRYCRFVIAILDFVGVVSPIMTPCLDISICQRRKYARCVKKISGRSRNTTMIRTMGCLKFYRSTNVYRDLITG